MAAVSACRWTLCLTLAGPISRREILHVCPTETVEEVFDRAANAFAPKLIESLSFGFPPKKLHLSNQSIQEVGIGNQELITIRVSEASPKKVGNAKKRKTAAAADATVPIEVPRQKSQRAAAEKANASFADTIQAQDALLQLEKKGRPSPEKTVSGKSRKNTTVRFSADITEGRRLQDGAVVAPKRSNRRFRPEAPRNGSSDETDPSLALLGSLEERSTAARLMRKGWRKAVNDAFEQNRAVARVAAIPAKAIFTFPETIASEVDTVGQTLLVTYPKGLQGRGDYEERVDYLPRDVLVSVIAAIHPVNPDALRPANLALLSPRVFWSVAYHGMEYTSISEALQALQPDLDWTFLRRRRETLSAKARENLRQKEEVSQTSIDNWEAAAAAIESVEHAMEKVHALDRSQRQARNLQAIERRSVWKILTPVEEDLDELTACISGGPIAGYTAEALAKGLIGQCTVHNWRQLANAKTETLIQKLGVSDDESTRALVQNWIDRAQQETLDEIMVEICDGNVEAVELLRESARSGTPRDLAVWKSIAESLHSELQCNSAAAAIPDVNLLQKWCDQAQHALEQLEWLAWYTTPIA
jgi:cell fate (sporulation/competence/biofilm development) regulator YmcA (YheA/YmcA/DUF963 family)